MTRQTRRTATAHEPLVVLAQRWLDARADVAAHPDDAAARRAWDAAERELRRRRHPAC